MRCCDASVHLPTCHSEPAKSRGPTSPHQPPHPPSKEPAHAHRLEPPPTSGHQRPHPHPRCRHSSAQAVAVKGGRISAIGSDDELRSWLTARPRSSTPAARTVLPGFIDGHTHFQSAAIQRAFLIDYIELKPKSIWPRRSTIVKREPLPAARHLDSRRRLRRALRRREALPDPLGDRRGRARPPDRPARHRQARHLRQQPGPEEAGIDRDTEDPPAARSTATSSGEPTGVLRERGKLRLDPARDDTVLPTFGVDQRREALRKGFQYLHSFGVPRSTTSSSTRSRSSPTRRCTAGRAAIRA